MREAVIVDAVSSPVGKRNGRLAGWRPTGVLAQTRRYLVERSGVDSDRSADVIAGCALQRGEQAGDLARYAPLSAGLPQSLAATTIDRRSRTVHRGHESGGGERGVRTGAVGLHSGVGIDTERLNVNGGSIAIGHPLGSTGARLITELVYELERRGGRYGLLAICEAGAMANATIVERIR